MPAHPRLEWEVKDSFVAYVEGLPDGCVKAFDGAVRSQGSFLFEGQQVAEGLFSFTGSVHFFGHMGLLDLTLTALRLRVASSEAVLTAEVGPSRVRVAEGKERQVSDDGSMLLDPVTLTGDGAALFGDVYAPGSLLSPVIVHNAY